MILRSLQLEVEGSTGSRGVGGYHYAKASKPLCTPYKDPSVSCGALNAFYPGHVIVSRRVLGVAVCDPRVAASRGALELVEGLGGLSGRIVGLGTGSTLQAFLSEAAKALMSAEGVVASSIETALKARSYGFRVLDPRVYRGVDIYVDGADEVELMYGSMIKGGGGALLGEKVLARSSRLNVFVVGVDKVVEVLGSRRPVPVDVESSFLSMVLGFVEELGWRAELRMAGGKRGPVVSDWGGVIVDVYTGPIKDPGRVERLLESIPGVRASGLFVGLADYVVVGYGDCRWRVYEYRRG